jgi:flagellar M-ring protein FliF
VIDADTNRPLGPSRRNGFSPNGDLEEQLSSQLVQTLEPVVGPQHVRARVNVEYDPSSSEENDETYDPKSVVAVSEQRSEERVGGALSAGVVGTSSNVPGGTPPPKPAVDSGDGSQLSKSESSTFAVNKVVRHTLQPAGRIRRITAALVVDDAVDVKQENGKREEVRRKRTAAELRQITELAKAAIGVDPSRGDVLTVQNLSFDQSPIEAPVKPSTIERVRTTLADWSGLVRYPALILLFLLTYTLVLRPVKNQLMTTFRELPALISSRKQSGLAPGQDMEGLPPEQRSLVLKRQLLDKVTAEPVATSKLIQAWIHEEAK